MILLLSCCRYSRRRAAGGRGGGPVVDTNVNERSGLFAALIRCDNPKLVCFGLRKHGKACIIWGRMQMSQPPHHPTHPTNTPTFSTLKPHLALDWLYLQLSQFWSAEKIHIVRTYLIINVFLLFFCLTFPFLGWRYWIDFLRNHSGAKINRRRTRRPARPHTSFCTRSKTLFIPLLNILVLAVHNADDWLTCQMKSLSA